MRARAPGHEVQFLDLCFVRNPAAAIWKTVAEFRPEILGITIRNIDNCDWQVSRPFLPTNAASRPPPPATLSSGPDTGAKPQTLGQVRKAFLKR